MYLYHYGVTNIEIINIFIMRYFACHPITDMGPIYYLLINPRLNSEVQYLVSNALSILKYVFPPENNVPMIYLPPLVKGLF